MNWIQRQCMGLVPKAIPIIRHWVKGEVSVKVGLSLCLTLDGKRKDLNVDFVLSIESLEA